MQADLIRDLEAQRPKLSERWEDLLRIERAISPLASPDILVHMFRLTLDELFAALSSGESHPAASRPLSAACPCGRNPLLTYFSAGRQALEEALVNVQASRPAVLAVERDRALAELEAAYGQIARREIESFCAVCQFRRPEEGSPVLVAANG